MYTDLNISLQIKLKATCGSHISLDANVKKNKMLRMRTDHKIAHFLLPFERANLTGRQRHSSLTHFAHLAPNNSNNSAQACAVCSY